MEELEKKAKNWKNGGSGTGLLLKPFLPRDQGWLVITNNHIIMDNYEAENAKVYFEYNHDEGEDDDEDEDEDEKPQFLDFKVQKLWLHDRRTSSVNVNVHNTPGE